MSQSGESREQRPSLRRRQTETIGSQWVLVVGEEDAGSRLDRFLADRCALGRRKVRRILEKGLVKVEGARTRPGTKLDTATRVSLSFDPDRISEQGPLPDPEIPVPIIEQTEELLVLDKPGGIPSVALSPFETGSLANALALIHPECVAASIEAGADPLEAGLVHRLDRDTSGLILAARDAATYNRLRKLSSRERLVKRYVALVRGRLTGKGIIRQAMVTIRHKPRLMGPARDPSDKRSMDAVSSYEVIQTGGEVSLVQVTLARGRPHQVRFHLAHLGHAILGDILYGGPQAPEALQPLALRCLAIQSADGALDFELSPPSSWFDFVQ